jgi:Phage late-transcription coactivator
MATKDEIQSFSEMIIRLATVCLYCEQSGLEIEVAATLLSQSIKSKIQEEATNLNLLKKEGRLPI